ncbi:MAG: hypothetical protein ACKO83_14210 [Roseiflexaceae bacterium]
MQRSFWPRTHLGWIAATSFGVFALLWIINGYMVKASGVGQWWLDDVQPIYSIAMIVTLGMSCGGSVSAWAIGGDNTWAVCIATLPIWVWVFINTMIVVLNALHL